MSTILIQKKCESKQTLIQKTKKKTMLEADCLDFKAEDFAGLSWLILDHGDEI